MVCPTSELIDTQTTNQQSTSTTFSSSNDVEDKQNDIEMTDSSSLNLVINPVLVCKIEPIKVSIPKISSRDSRPVRAHSPVAKQLEQAEVMIAGPGAKREPNKQYVKLKSVELEDAIKRAKKYAMEQSVRFVLVKQQQQQQKQQLDLIKKQQALLLMCR